MRQLLNLFLVLSLCAGCAPAQGTPEAGEDLSAPTGEVSSVQTSGSEDLSSGSTSTDVSTEPESQPDPEPEPEPLPLEGRIICVDPGHCITPDIRSGRQERISPLSEETKRAFGGGTSGKHQTEEYLNLVVGLKLRDRLEELGAQVVMTREVSEITVTNQERCEIAYDSGSEVCVRIHADGNTDSSVHGVSVLIPWGDLLGTPSIVDESARLGELMVNAVAEETGAKNRGTRKRSDLTGFNFAQVPTVLIEMGFMTNPEEDALMETEEYQDKIITGIINSLLEWYGATEE